MSKHRVLGFESQLRLEWRGQDGQNETKQPDHSASLGDSITSSTRTGFSVHTALRVRKARGAVEKKEGALLFERGGAPILAAAGWKKLSLAPES
jgi:hypothetical protein